MKESQSIEMDDMSQEYGRRRQQISSSQVDLNFNDHNPTEKDEQKLPLGGFEGTISTWSYITAIWFLFMSIPFLAFPRFLLFLSGPSKHSGPTGSAGYRESLTSLEKFLSTHFAIFSLSIAAALIISIPQEMHIVSKQYKQENDNPLVLTLTIGLLISSFLSYNTSSSEVGPLAMFMCIGTGLTGLWGLFSILFAGSSSISRKTGVDKRTSRFLFWNSSAASAQKNRQKQNG